MKKQLLTIALTTLCLSKLFAQTYTEVEPNNSFAQANLVTAPVTIIDSMGTTSDNDYFKVDLASCGVLSVKLSNVPFNQFIRLYVYNASQAQIGFVQSLSTGSGFTYDLLLPSGISYLKVFDNNGNVSSHAMQLALTLDNTDGCECNNSFASACTISPNTTIHPQMFGYNSDLGGNDVDYFKLNLPSCGVVRVNLSNLASNQFMRLYAYNSSQSQIAFVQSPSTGSGFTYDLLLPSGISYLKLFDNNGNSDSTHLNMTLTYDTTDACECNNSFATACTISPNTTIHPQMFGYNSDLGGNDVDYFMLNLPSCGVVTINLSNLALNQFMRLYAYNSTFSQIGFIQSPSTGSGFSYDLLLPSGVSYLKLFDNNGNSNSIHQNLTLSYDTSDACECNNSFATACLVSAVDTLYPQMFGYNSDLGGNDVDYYEIHPNNCVSECINISNVQSGQFLRLYVYNSTQTQIGFAQSPSTGVGFNYCLNLGIGTYYLKLLDNNGLSSSGHITVALTNTPTLPAPTVTVSGSTSFCLGDSVTLTSNSTNFNHWSTGDTTQSIVVYTAGVYTDTIINLSGCWAYSTATTVTVNQATVPTVNQIGNTLQSTTATTYQWYLGGSILNGATSQTYIPTQNGDYTVVTTDANGCSATSAPFTVSTVGVAELNIESLISVFPNPTNGSFTITFPETTKQVQITNSMGQVLQTNLVDRQKNLNLELTADGIYFIHIRTDKQVVTKKLIVCK